MVYASLKERAGQHKTRILKVRSYKNFNEEKFKEDLKMAAWHVGESFESVDEQYEYWEALLNKIVDDHLPTRDTNLRAHNVPYMTREWKNAIKAKRSFSKKIPHQRILNWRESGAMRPPKKEEKQSGRKKSIR